MEEFAEMKREGLSLKAISGLTGYDRKTVRKYLSEPEAAPRYGPRARRPSRLDEYKPYLESRLQAGVWNAQATSGGHAPRATQSPFPSITSTHRPQNPQSTRATLKPEDTFLRTIYVYRTNIRIRINRAL
jgi:hypothetical protein